MRFTANQVVVVVASTFILIVPERSLTEKSSDPRPSVVVRESIESSPGRIEIAFRFPAPKVLVRPGHNRVAAVEMEGALPLAEPGLPDIPFFSSLIAVPECDQIDLSAEVRNVQILGDVDVAVVPEAPTEDRARAAALSSRTGDIPGVWARVVDIQHARGQALARIEVYPARVDPRRRTISCPQEIRVVLTPVNPRGSVSVNAGPLQDALNAVVPNLDGITPSLNDFQPVPGKKKGGPSLTSGTGQVCWCNSADDDWEAAADYVNANCAADYLIIVAGELSVGFDSVLVDSLARKRAEFNGFNVAIVPMNQIDSTPDNSVTGTPLLIRNLVEAVYDSESAGHLADGRLGYLLLIGDAINPNGDYILPTYVPYPSDYNGFTTNGRLNASEAFFVLLDGPSDVVPDILMGRLPVDADQDQWELGNVVGKLTTYEPVNASAAWPDKILLMSGGDDENFTFAGEGLGGFQEFFDAIETIAAGQRTFEQMHRLAASSDELFSEEVCDSITAGYGIVGLFDHANPVSFANAFFPLHYDVLQNDNSPSLFFSIGSHSGFFDRVATQWCCPNTSYSTIPCKTLSNLIDDCDALAERLVVQPAGAIGVVAYGRTNDAVVVQRAFANLFTSLTQHKLGHLGSLVLAAKLLTGDIYTMQALNLLGDPALSVDYRFDAVAGDSLDLAVSGLDIAFSPAQKDFASTASQAITVKVSNHWKEPATSVPVEVWRGPPEVTGSSLLNSFTLSAVPAFGQSSWSGSIGSFSVGDHDIHVTVDPDDSLDDPVRTNNVSYRTLYVRDYVTGYPVAASADHVGVLDAVLGAPQKLEIACAGVLYDAEGTSLGFGGPGPAGNVYRSDTRHFVLINNPVIVRAAAETSQDYFSIEGAQVRDVILLDHGGPEGMLAAIRTQEGLDSKIRLHDLNGISNHTLWTRTIGDQFHGTLVLKTCAMAAGDVTDDGVADVVYAFSPSSSSAADSLGVIDGRTGDRVWTVATGAVEFAHAYLRLVDLENDGELEIVTNTRVAGSPDEDRIQCYDASRTALWQVVAGFKNAADLGAHTFHAPADMDHDGVKEVVFAREKRLGIITVSGSSATVSHEVNLTGDRLLHSTPLMADIDGDGHLEIVAFCLVRDHYLNEWSLELQVYDDDLSPVATTTFPWDSSLSGGPYKGPFEPAIADIDGDGVFEVMFTTPNGTLHAVHVGTSAGRADWVSFWGDPMRTGLYEQTLAGTYDEPVAIVNRARVLENTTFAEGLAITAPADLLVGVDDSLFVNGPLSVLGSEDDSVRVRLDDLASAGSYWGGIVYDDPTSVGCVNLATISRARTALRNSSPLVIKNSRISEVEETAVAAFDSLWVEASTIEGSGADGIYTNESCTRKITVKRCLIQDCDDFGLNAYSEGDVAVDSTTFRTCDMGAKFRYGHASITSSLFESCLSFGADVGKNATSFDVARSTFAGNDIGLSVSGIGSVDSCLFSDNEDAVSITSDELTDVWVARCTIEQSGTSGIYLFAADNPGAVVIRNNVVTDQPVGIYDYGASPEIRRGNVIQENTSGIKCDNNSHAAIESCTVNNNTYGVNVESGNPDLGHVSGGSSVGYNILKPNTIYHVRNDVLYTTVGAQQNYWPQGPPSVCYPRATKLYGGVDSSYALCTQPSLAAQWLGGDGRKEGDPPRVFRLGQNAPNPFNPTTTVSFEIPAPASVKVAVYDISGAIVAVLVNRRMTPGSYRVTWDGKNRSGAPVSSGVYFLRMQANGFVDTKKILLLK